MSKKNISFFITFLLPLAIIEQAWIALPVLNEKVVTHFGINGRADGWSSKENFFWIEVLLSLFIFLLFSSKRIEMERASGKS